jgi:hypothetical protein
MKWSGKRKRVVRRGGDFADPAGARGADGVGPQPLGHPEPRAGEFDDHPGLVGVGDDVRIAAVAGIAVLGDQGGDDLDPFARGAGAFQHDAGEVGIVGAGLVGRGHRDQFGARGDQMSRTATPCSFSPPLVIGAGTPR